MQHLDPRSGLFPETLVVPFVVAPEVEDLAEDVLASFDEFRPIREAIANDGLRIRYVFETKAFDPTKDELKPHTIAKVTKAGPIWRLLAEAELVISFRQWFWEKFSEQERRGVLHHELTHIEIGEDSDANLKVSLREHDVEEFRLTARRFGPRRMAHEQLFEAFLAWERENGPTPLRKLRPVENIAEAVAEAAVDSAGALQGLADGSGTTITVKAAGREATIKPRRVITGGRDD